MLAGPQVTNMISLVWAGGTVALILDPFIFFFTVALTLDPFILKWWQPQLQPSTAANTTQFTFSCYVMTFLRFLGVLPASLEALCGPCGVIYGLQYCTEKTWEDHERSLLLQEICTFLDR